MSASAVPPVPVSLRGQALLADPRLNKGLAFPVEERRTFGLNGLLPVGERTLEEQVALAWAGVEAQETLLGRHVRLRQLQDDNETLFYAVLSAHLPAALPIVYTPGVGEGCLNFSRLWERPRGVFLSAEHKGNLAAQLEAVAGKGAAIRLIIVTDGERILGLGDLGANGMGIPIGKLALYTACANLDPAQLLPVLLDVGTDNQALLDDPAYIGLRRKRLRGEAYDAFVEEFVGAVQDLWPGALLHWEDFANRTAPFLLERYRDRLPSFNDDIQGTASVALAAILAGVRARGETLAQQRIVIAGGGSAGCGIALLLEQVMEDEGLTPEAARDRFYLIDRPGLLTADMQDLTPAQARLARTDLARTDAGRDLARVVARIHPTILIGVSGQAGLFTEEIIRTMARHCERPMIFPLSNPTHLAEATPADLCRWTDGRALVSTGSPFPPVTHGDLTMTVDQTNNAYIFPGLGLGVLACQARAVSDGMLQAAARAVAVQAPLLQGGLNMLPPVTELPQVAQAVARAVAMQAQEEKLCPPFTAEELETRLTRMHWVPVYRPYQAA
ncbi:NAD-dependent malic enzyme [Oecophyllibacter saccharovorans]|uniref:NAD-dependent malic enzyme n=1 Tax=Oecophyllibacter saccharovorans TaxID=2558360 RepID=UPI00117487D9|nr:NAD-dependent malic enzyme [Oecophyllibacter saccharovorans]TPW36501.1 NAD-dependent malic enzyme [Oecophyllibacter saccharovorans]